MNDQTVLVTGATGFIGRNICSVLRERGFRVRGTYRTESQQQLADTDEWVRIEDVGPDTDWSEALDGVDYVVHLAALAHQVGRSGQNRCEEFMRVNADGTRALAHQAVDSGVKRLVFMSSAGAAATLSDRVLDESSPCCPDTDYGRSKLAGEEAVAQEMRDSAEWCIIRPPLVYGPGNPGNMARLIGLIAKGIPLPTATDRGKRSFIYVGNLCGAIETCLVHANATRRTFFVTDGPPVSTAGLIRLLSYYAGRSPRFASIPMPVLSIAASLGDAIGRISGRELPITSYSLDRLCGSLVLDDTAIRSATGWVPVFSLEDGIRRTFAPLSEPSKTHPDLAATSA